MAVGGLTNALKNGSASQRTGGELVSDTFRFEGSKETFDHRVIITVPHAAHAQLGQSRRQTVLVSCAGILGALVRMVQHPRFWLAGDPRHAPGSLHQGGIHLLGHRPASEFEQSSGH